METMADPMAVTWTEKHSKRLERIWSKLPNFLGSFIATVAVFLLGSSIRGEVACNHRGKVFLSFFFVNVCSCFVKKNLASDS